MPKIRSEVSTNPSMGNNNTYGVENNTATQPLQFDDLNLMDAFVSDNTDGLLKSVVEELADSIPSERRIGNAIVKYGMYYLDKNDIKNLTYSGILITMDVYDVSGKPAGETHYMTVLLGKTGYSPLTAEEFINPNTKFKYVPIDAFNNILDEKVSNVLNSERSGNRIIKTTGLFIYEDDPKEIVKNYSLTIQNTLIASLIKSKNAVKGFDLIKETRDKRFRFVIEPVYSKVIDNKSNKRMDFRIYLRKLTNTNDVREMNREAGNQDLCITTGYVDYVPIEIEDQYSRTKRIKFRPMIVINDVITKYQHPSVVLLGIMSGLVYNNHNQLYGLLMESPRDIGILNFIANLENNPNGYGKKKHIKSGKVSQQEVNDIIRNIIYPYPLLVMEIEQYTPGNFIYKDFINLVTNNGVAYMNSVVEGMTGVNPNLQSYLQFNNLLYIPYGTYVNNKGEVLTTSELDTISVIDSRPELIHTYFNSLIYNNTTYESRLEVIAKTIPNAEIKNNNIRLVFDPQALSTIGNLMANTGYSPYNTSDGYKIDNVVDISMFNTLKGFDNNNSFVNYGSNNSYITPNTYIY